MGIEWWWLGLQAGSNVPYVAANDAALDSCHGEVILKPAMPAPLMVSAPGLPADVMGLRFPVAVRLVLRSGDREAVSPTFSGQYFFV